MKISTLVVRGAHSDVVSDAGLADILQRIPTARAADVAGDDNDVFAATLEEFLADLD